MFVVKKSKISGTLRVPSSKSHTLRALLFAAMAKGKSTIHSYLDSHDTKAMVEAIRIMGAEVSLSPEKIEVIGTGGAIGPFEDVIQGGNSGLVLRLFTALAAVSSHPMVITGDHSLRHLRPVKDLTSALEELGAKVTSLKGDGFAPLIVQGPLTGHLAHLSGEDSQPVSALLIAAAFKKGPTEIVVSDPGEIPWVALTLDWFERLGIPFENEGFCHYRLKGGTTLRPFEYTVPGDFSSAAFPLVAALITRSPLELQNVDMKDSQGDKELIPLLRRMGAEIEIDSENRSLRVLPGAPLKGIEVNINNFIDALPILAVLACYAEGESRIFGAEVARNKECNRLKAISEELQKMGGSVIETREGLWITPAPLFGATLFSHHDHRIAMSLAVAALGAVGETRIEETECIGKTFPTFLADFKKLGASLHER